MIDIILDTVIDCLKLIPFLFIAFLLIELLEHKFGFKSKKIISNTKSCGPLIGSFLGLFPQCGFSVMATNLYVTRIISIGTLISIYLSTSDEMLPILLSQKAEFSIIFKILFLKFIIGIISGFLIDFILRKRKNKKLDYNICEMDDCNCDEENIFLCSLKHTMNTLLFIFIISFILNILISYLDNDTISKIFMKDKIFAPFLSCIIGLIPNCGASVMITELYLSNVLSLGTAIGGLLTGSGVAILVLFKSNKNIKENIAILLIIYLIGSVSGIIINLFETLLF